MKAIRVLDGRPRLVDASPPDADGNLVVVDVRSSSICGSDLHMLPTGMVEGRILGHEFAGLAPDGTPVAVEPLIACGDCHRCVDGDWYGCTHGSRILGVMADGAMAEQVAVPSFCLTPLPSGLDLSVANLTEPVAVGLRAVNRAAVEPGDRVLVIGAGPIGLGAVAVLSARGITAHVAARHPHQTAPAARLGATADVDGQYPVVIDAAATPGSFRQAVASCVTGGRVVLAGTPWEPLEVDLWMASQEIDLLPSMGYGVTPDGREFAQAATLLASEPAVADTLITHRFPLDGVDEAFATAADRSAGAIKVVFDLTA